MLKKNTLKTKLKNLKTAIRIKISNLFYRWVKKPIQDRKQRKLVEKAQRDLIKSFEKSFNVNHNEILRLNKMVNTNFSLSEKQTYLNQKLKEGAEAMAGYTNKSPMFYDPEIINIHNDFNELKEKPTLYEIIKEESDLNSKRFREQEYQFYRENYPKEKRLNLLNKRFGILKN